MKIAHYVPHGAVPDHRGFAPAIVAFQSAKRLRTFTPFIISAQEDYAQTRETIEGVDIHRIAMSPAYRRLFNKITRLDPYPLHARAATLANRIGLALFHAHQLEFEVDDFRRRLKKSLPIVVHAHVEGRHFQLRRGRADAYIAVSRFVAARLVEQGYPGDLIHVVQNGVDTQLFAPIPKDERASLRRALNIPESAPVLLFVGRKQEVKGFDTFLKTTEILLQRHPDLYALAVGGEPGDASREASYPERQQLRARLAGTGRFLDYAGVDHKKLSKFYALADIALLPSRNETQGMAMIEAMASGCLTVSSDLEGIRESIVHKQSGLLLENPESLEEIAGVIEQALCRPNDYTAMRCAGRERAVLLFDWNVCAAQLESVYTRLLGNDGGGR